MSPVLLRLQVPDGLTLRDSSGKTYEGGKPFQVERNQFWARRITDGSVVVLTPEPAQAPIKEAK